MDRRRIGVRAIIYRDGKILAVRHKDRNGEPKDFWAVPGGGLDPGESLIDGLRRELHEELGIDVKPGRLLFIQQFLSGRSDCEEELEFFFLVENPEDFDDVDFSHTSHGTDELANCEFITPASENVRPRFLRDIDLMSFTETVQPVLISDYLNE